MRCSAVGEPSRAGRRPVPLIHIENGRSERNDHAINRVNTLHSLFSGFMSGFRGVSTKRLGEYLTWFLWQRTYRIQQPDVAARQVNVIACDNTVRDWANATPPYMDYWQAA